LDTKPSIQNGSQLQFTLHHMGVAVRSIRDALPAYKAVFGFDLLHGPIDDPIQRVTVCFIGNPGQSSSLIELIAPLGEDSPVSSVLAKGIGAYHMCYEVDDLDAAISNARAHGCIVVAKPVPAVAFDGRRIAWLFMRTQQLIELLER